MAPQGPGHMSQCRSWEDGWGPVAARTAPCVGLMAPTADSLWGCRMGHRKVAPEIHGINFYLASRVCPFICQLLPRNSLVLTGAPEELSPTPSILCPLTAPVWLGCYGNPVTPCFSKRLSWQMPKGVLCLWVTCSGKSRTPCLCAQSLPGPLKSADQLTPAHSTLGSPLQPA